MTLRADRAPETVFDRLSKHHQATEVAARSEFAAVRAALSNVGATSNDARVGLYQPHTRFVRNYLMDQQHFNTFASLPGVILLDFDRSHSFIQAVLPTLVDETGLVRVGIDLAGTKAAVVSPDQEHAFSCSYLTLSHPLRQDLAASVTVGALLPPETAQRYDPFITYFKKEFRKLGIRRGFLHGDHGFQKKRLRISDCPWCSITQATLRLGVFNTDSLVLLDPELPEVPGLLHFLCVLISAVLKAHPTPDVRANARKWTKFDFDKAAVDYDGVSIKELTALAVDPSSLCQLLPEDLSAVVIYITDMRLFYQERSMSDWLDMMGVVTKVLQAHDADTVGSHIGWHFPAISRQLFRGSLCPFIEQVVEHICQEMIYLRRSHNLYSLRRLLQWRNVVHYPHDLEYIRLILATEHHRPNSQAITIHPTPYFLKTPLFRAPQPLEPHEGGIVPRLVSFFRPPQTVAIGIAFESPAVEARPEPRLPQPGARGLVFLRDLEADVIVGALSLTTKPQQYSIRTARGPLFILDDCLMNFANHSRHPTMLPVDIRFESQDYAVFMTLRPVRAGEAATFEYRIEPDNFVEIL